MSRATQSDDIEPREVDRPLDGILGAASVAFDEEDYETTINALHLALAKVKRERGGSE